MDHEPSVPTLEVLLLSCLAFAGVHCLQALLAGSGSLQRGQALLLQCAAAVVAVVFELLVRKTFSGGGGGVVRAGVG